MEPSVEPIQYPSMRKEVVLAVQALADPEYQQRVWIRHEYPHGHYYDDFDQNVNLLFDDVAVLPQPENSVGSVLYPNEIDTLQALGAVLDPLITKLGNVDDAQYLSDPQWTRVVVAARNAHRVLVDNDSSNRPDH